MVRGLIYFFFVSLMGCSSFESRETIASKNFSTFSKVPNMSTVSNRDIAALNQGAGGFSGDLQPYRTTSFKNHNMRVINNGMAAFYQRIDMIRRAKKTLELEYFIFNPDTSGRIIMQELIKAADRGVAVRILVDKSVAVFELDEYYAMILREHGIQLRYYNPAPLINLYSIQFRNHRKLMVRDDEEAITGGRNIADDYFNLSKQFNFLDRDVWIQGEIVPVMRSTFDLYWKSDIVEVPMYIGKPILFPSINREFVDYGRRMSEAKSVFWRTPEENRVLRYAMDYGKKAFSQINVYQCPEVTFATDRESASFIETLLVESYEKNYRLLRKEIAKWMEKVKDEVILDSPYILKDGGIEEVFENLLRLNKKVTILTNSLSSTDEVYVSTVFNSAVTDYTGNPNFNAYVYNGKFSSESELYSDEVLKSEWGVHSKTIVFNDDSVMIGTYNVDHRSNFFNTEMALFCRGSKELVQDVKENIQLRMRHSYHLNKDGLPDDGTPLLSGSSDEKKTLYYFLKIPATLGQFLL